MKTLNTSPPVGSSTVPESPPPLGMSPICPTCGCSLVRLGIAPDDAARYEHRDEQLLFCCQGCVDLFRDHADTYLAEIRDWSVCPTCLAEKPEHLTVSISHEGQEVRFCRCPHCVEEFLRRPDELLARLAG
jgi:YHS domain-containing protein